MEDSRPKQYDKWFVVRVCLFVVGLVYLTISFLKWRQDFSGIAPPDHIGPLSEPLKLAAALLLLLIGRLETRLVAILIASMVLYSNGVATLTGCAAAHGVSMFSSMSIKCANELFTNEAPALLYNVMLASCVIIVSLVGIRGQPK